MTRYKTKVLSLAHNLHPHCFLVATTRVSTMDTKPQRPSGQGGVLSSLNAVIDALNLVKSVSDVTPAKAAFDSTSVLLSTIRVGFLLLTLVGCRLIYTGLCD